MKHVDGAIIRITAGMPRDAARQITDCIGETNARKDAVIKRLAALVFFAEFDERPSLSGAAVSDDKNGSAHLRSPLAFFQNPACGAGGNEGRNFVHSRLGDGVNQRVDQRNCVVWRFVFSLHQKADTGMGKLHAVIAEKLLGFPLGKILTSHEFMEPHRGVLCGFGIVTDSALDGAHGNVKTLLGLNVIGALRNRGRRGRIQGL